MQLQGVLLPDFWKFTLLVIKKQIVIGEARCMSRNMQKTFDARWSMV